jgi:hypothetical protein
LYLKEKSARAFEVVTWIPTLWIFLCVGVPDLILATALCLFVSAQAPQMKLEY